VDRVTALSFRYETMLPRGEGAHRSTVR
jgi:hypothetical protein